MGAFELFVYALTMSVISSAIAMLLAPKPQKPVAGQLEVPTAEEGGSIPVCFGTNIVKQSNVIWYGDPRVDPIYSKGGGKK